MKGRSTNKKDNKRKLHWEHCGWWARTSLRDFAPLFAFANQNIDENNWADAIWQALGRERLCLVTSKVNKQPMRIFASDVADQEDFDKVTPHLPKIARQEATLALVTKLQAKVRQILDCIIAKISLVARQRSGKDDTAWVEQARENDLVFKLTGEESDYWSLPWASSHFEDYREILLLIQKEFDASGTRKAIIHSTGFLFFDDEGEDACRTLSWLLMGLVDVVFERERAVLKKCHWCEKYFVHETLKRKEFCSNRCRYDNRNKGTKG